MVKNVGHRKITAKWYKYNYAVLMGGREGWFTH